MHLLRRKVATGVVLHAALRIMQDHAKDASPSLPEFHV